MHRRRHGDNAAAGRDNPTPDLGELAEPDVERVKPPVLVLP
jgi:hypothetical protein